MYLSAHFAMNKSPNNKSLNGDGNDAKADSRQRALTLPLPLSLIHITVASLSVPMKTHSFIHINLYEDSACQMKIHNLRLSCAKTHNPNDVTNNQSSTCDSIFDRPWQVVAKNNIIIFKILICHKQSELIYRPFDEFIKMWKLNCGII